MWFCCCCSSTKTTLLEGLLMKFSLISRSHVTFGFSQLKKGAFHCAGLIIHSNTIERTIYFLPLQCLSTWSLMSSCGNKLFCQHTLQYTLCHYLIYGYNTSGFEKALVSLADNNYFPPFSTLPQQVSHVIFKTFKMNLEIMFPKH